MAVSGGMFLLPILVVSGTTRNNHCRIYSEISFRMRSKLSASLVQRVRSEPKISHRPWRGTGGGAGDGATAGVDRYFHWPLIENVAVPSGGKSELICMGELDRPEDILESVTS
jgi:hypothetical protein